MKEHPGCIAWREYPTVRTDKKTLVVYLLFVVPRSGIVCKAFNKHGIVEVMVGSYMWNVVPCEGKDTTLYGRPRAGDEK